jgi:hypothetical protein
MLYHSTHMRYILAQEVALICKRGQPLYKYYLNKIPVYALVGWQPEQCRVSNHNSYTNLFYLLSS